VQTHFIRRTSTADELAEALRARILSGEMLPGSTVPEIPLAEAFGVSRNTMREAMRILILEGLLKRRVHRGVTVAELSPADVAEIYALRRLLELKAVSLAGGATRQDFQPMAKAVKDFQAAALAGEWVAAVDADMRFHAALVALHRSPRLVHFYRKVFGELRLGMVLVDRVHDNPRRLIPQHKAMLEALEGRRLKECAQMLMRHLDDSERRLQGIFGSKQDVKQKSAMSAN
jgi:DNA-binding GntR family transcriptional regulator